MDSRPWRPQTDWTTSRRTQQPPTSQRVRRPPPPEFGQNVGEWRRTACGCFFNFTLYSRGDDDDADAYDVEAVKVPLTISWEGGGGIKNKRGVFFTFPCFTKGWILLEYRIFFKRFDLSWEIWLIAKGASTNFWWSNALSHLKTKESWQIELEEGSERTEIILPGQENNINSWKSESRSRIF